MILLDTNVVIGIVNDRSPRLRAEFERQLASGEHIWLSSVVIFELKYGIAKSRRQHANERLLRGFMLAPLSTLPFDEDDAAQSAGLRAILETAGTPIGPYDVLIAGQALRHGATLVTANTREFARVPGLKVEDWAK